MLFESMTPDPLNVYLHLISTTAPLTWRNQWQSMDDLAAFGRSPSLDEHSMVWIWLLLALVPVAILVTGLMLCLPYWRSPEKRWRDDVLLAHQAAERQVQKEEKNLRHLKNQRDTEKESLEQKALQRFFATVQVEELATRPGIGPATVDRLKAAGFDNLATLQNARINLQGIGEKRLSDIRNAVNQLTREGESRFNAGESRQVKELKSELSQIEEKYTTLECATKGRARGAAQVIDQLERAVDLARRVTFWKFFWKDSQMVVPLEFLDAELPSLESAVNRAEQKALNQLRGKEPAFDKRPESKLREETSIPEVLPVFDSISSLPSRSESGFSTDPDKTNRLKVAHGTRKVSPTSHASAHRPLNSGNIQNSSRETESLTAPPKGLVESTIEFAYAIARAGGSLGSEVDAFIRFQMQRPFLNSNPAQYHSAKAWCDLYQNAPVKIELCAQRITAISTQEDQVKLIEFAFQVAQVSDPIEQRAILLIEQTAQNWGITWKPVIVGSPLGLGGGGPSIPPAIETTSKAIPEKRRVKESAPVVRPTAQPAAFLGTATSTGHEHSPTSTKDLVELTIEFAFAIARTDGSVSGAESTLINDQMQRRFGYNPALYNRVKAWCAHYQTAAIRVELCLKRIKEATTIAHRVKLLEFACLIAEASGSTNEREAHLMERIAHEWEIPPMQLAADSLDKRHPSIPVKFHSEPSSKTSPPAVDPRAVLGIDPKTTLTVDLIRRQFNLRMAQLSSEKLEAMGPEFVALAKSKRDALRTAGEALISPLQEPLEPSSAQTDAPEIRHNPDLDSMFGD
jgi:uncharacterized tellurite resistance protein B-like protein